MQILIAGGAGFVGNSLCLNFRKRYPKASIVALDNLRRRGSELNLNHFKEQGIQFVHGDTRNIDDIEAAGKSFDLFIDASAEPSVLAGLDGSPQYVLDTNLKGTLNCLEFARKKCGRFLYLSTSRVYSIAPLRQICLNEKNSRFEISDTQTLPGVSRVGISESFPTNLPRSLYGATKLASEMFVQEYVNSFGMNAVINRCGVIAGPGQFGKVDQGVFTLWVARHFFTKGLQYTGFGGTGKQVRDLLHPEDLFCLIDMQINSSRLWDGDVFNVGGGLFSSTSLVELTEICQRVTGNKVDMLSVPETNPVDIPIYVTNNEKVSATYNWQPSANVEKIISDIHLWLKSLSKDLQQIFN